MILTLEVVMGIYFPHKIQNRDQESWFPVKI